MNVFKKALLLSCYLASFNHLLLASNSNQNDDNDDKNKVDDDQANHNDDDQANHNDDDQANHNDDVAASVPSGASLSSPQSGSSVDSAGQLSCPSSLDNMILIDQSAVLYYALVQSNTSNSLNGILCGRLEVEDNVWIGLAVSMDGEMVGSEAIIGLPDDNTVFKYSLNGYSVDSVVAMDESKQTLTNTSILQENGKTTMGFIKLLEEDGEIPILAEAVNNFLFAKGSSNSLGFHAAALSFQEQLIVTQVSESTSPTSPNVQSTAPAPASAASTNAPVLSTKETTNTSQMDCIHHFCENQLAENFLTRYRINVPQGTTAEQCDGCTISFEVVYDGEAWVSIAFSKDGEMIGSEAVIGIPGENGNVPQKYDLAGKSVSQTQLMPSDQQTLTDASVTVNNGQTIMKFTKIMKESSEIDIKLEDNYFLWAHGSSTTLGFHASRGSYVQNLSTGTSESNTLPNKAAWLAHGIMGFLAWGVLVPMAVQSSILRILLPKGPIWFQLHRAFNGTAYALFVALFAIAVAYIAKEGEEHFDGGHQLMGLAMLILASLQVVGGIFRPHVPDSGQEKSFVRKGWEIGHRITGVSLLGCGFWQIGEGIEEYCDKYSINENVQDKYLLGYWVWIGLMSLIMIVGGGYFKFCHKVTKDNDEVIELEKPAREEGNEATLRQEDVESKHEFREESKEATLRQDVESKHE